MWEDPTDRKTPGAIKADPNVTNVAQSDKRNVLNSYRSYTYNWTLAALRREAVNNPELYRTSSLEFVILKSGGKGTRGISTDISAVDRVAGQEEYEAEVEESVPIREDGRIIGYQKQKVKRKLKRDIYKKDFAGKDLVTGFNKNSPGRFDLFIDNIEIETLMAFSQEGGTTLPTSLKFKVFEPYSINGFIEALHVSAVAAGYPSYTEASFILKLEFVGYPDDDQKQFPSPETINNTTRYFPIKFTAIDVEIGEKGTNYNVAAIPYTDGAFGNPNVLKRPITMSGNSVKEVLQNFAANLNTQIKADTEAAQVGAKDSDEYEILFPIRTPEGLNYNETNDIGNSTIQSILRNNAIYKFPDPGKEPKRQTPKEKDAQPEEVKLHPTSGTPPQIQFAENQQINEIIAAVIRDSEYVKNILKEKKIDNNGFIDYFMIKADIFNKEEINPATRKCYQKYTFSILPYKIHFTRIPGYANQKFDTKNILALSLREYNYIYTGQNIDVINFKLNFDKLFFEAIPTAMGNSDQPALRDTAGQPNDSKERLAGTDMDNEATDQTGSPVVRQVAQPVIMDGANAGQRSNDPYYQLARNMHNAIVNSKASMLKGEIDIIGDPFYLVTGGMGNYDPKPGTISGVTEDGEVDYTQGEVLITINFRNPIDINPLNKGGTAFFESEKIPFSGVYRVLKVQSSFNDGFFKQRLEIIRYPGQIIGKTKPTNIDANTVEEPVPNAQTKEGTSLGQNQGGSTPSTFDLLQLTRGLPTPGLPGVLSNFVGLQGGLGGVASNLLPQVSGAIGRGLGQLAGAAGVLGANTPLNIDQLSSGIRLQTSGLINLTEKNLSDPSSVVQANNILSSGFNITGGIKSMAETITSNAKSLLNKVSIPGSGIGEGASVLVNKVGSLSEPSVNFNSGVGNIDIVSSNIVPSNALSSIGGQASELADKVLTKVQGIGSNVSGFVSNIGDKISELTRSTPSDPSALAAKFGIDTNQLSGLSDGLRSKIENQLSQLAQDVPEDADLDIATARGLILKYIPQDRIENIPATAPYLTAPNSEVDEEFLRELLATSGVQGVANAYGVTDFSNISKDLLSSSNLADLTKSLPSGNGNLFSQTNLKDITGQLSAVQGQFSGNTNLSDITALSGKISGANSILGNVVSNTRSVEANISAVTSKVGNVTTDVRNISYSVTEKFQSKSGPSPLDKLFS